MLNFIRKIKFIKVFWVFFYFFLFCLILRGSFNYLDPDLGWHLKVGQEIAQTRSVPHLNQYNYTFTGNWVDHEWLSNFLVYQVYNNWGYPALVFIFALLVLAILIIINIFTRRFLPGKETTFFVAFFQMFGVVASLPHLGVRIQELAILFLLVVLLIIYYYNKTKNWRLLIVFLPLFYLWACLHASFLIGFFILFFWLGTKLLEKILERFWPSEYLDFSGVLKFKDILVFFIFISLAIGVTLGTPYKLELYSFLGGYSNTFYFSYIQEWLSQFSYPFYYWQLIYLSFVAVALIIYGHAVYQKQRSLNLWSVFLLLLFFILSFKSRRHLPLLFISSFVFLIDIYSANIKSSIKNLNLWLKACLLFCLFLEMILQLIQINFITDPFKSFNRDYPRGALEFLRDKPEYTSLNIFNHYSWGGYLIWVSPEIKPFIDGRLPQAVFKDKTFLEEYLEFYKKDIDREAKLREYDIKLILIQAQEKPLKAKKWEKVFFGIKNEEINPPDYLKEYLINSSAWRTIYYDQAAVLYLRVD